MIARLTGRLMEKRADHAIIDVGGVGYRVIASVSCLSRWPPVGQEVVARIHTHVREDSLELYGFADEVEETVFHALVGIPSIGPKKAVTILSSLPPEEIVQAVNGADVARLSKAQGVGKKTAERLVLELKDKLFGLGLTLAVDGGAPSGDNQTLEDLVAGLVHLGYKADPSRKAAEEVLEQLGPLELPLLLKEALARLR